jgi:hypothetical protein
MPRTQNPDSAVNAARTPKPRRVSPHPLWRILCRRDAAATALGSLLLFLTFVVLVIGTFTGHVRAEVIVNAFILLLGYFFGHVGAK